MECREVVVRYEKEYGDYVRMYDGGFVACIGNGEVQGGTEGEFGEIIGLWKGR